MDQKDFDAWNEQKKSIHVLGQGPRFFYAREVWWCAVGLNVGVEIDGKHRWFERPVLIIRRFNRNMFWGVPLTRGRGSDWGLLPVSHRGSQSWAVLPQLTLLSTKRLLRRIDMAPMEQFNAIQQELLRLIKADPLHLE